MDKDHFVIKLKEFTPSREVYEQLGFSETFIAKMIKDGEKEVERIKVSAQPSSLDNTYSLVGCKHLLDTKVAQMVIDIFEGCSKIRY